MVLWENIIIPYSVTPLKPHTHTDTHTHVAVLNIFSIIYLFFLLFLLPSIYLPSISFFCVNPSPFFHSFYFVASMSYLSSSFSLPLLSWSLFTFLTSAGTPGYTLKPKDSELRSTIQRKLVGIILVALGYLIQSNILQLYLVVFKFHDSILNS